MQTFWRLGLAGAMALACGLICGASARSAPPERRVAPGTSPAENYKHNLLQPASNKTAHETNGNPAILQALEEAVGLEKPEDGVNTAALIHQNTDSPTYLRDVLPVFMRLCARCHNNQNEFGFDWLDYKTAYRERWEIRRRIWDSWEGTFFSESMPLEKSPESLAINNAERAKIRDWVMSGGFRGMPVLDARDQTKAERIDLGRRLATSLCAACHQAGFQGIPNMFPPLAGSDFLNADKMRAIKTVIYGRQGEVIVNGMKFNNRMPSFPLTDDDIANALTFVYNALGNCGLEVTPEEVRALRGQPVELSTTPAPPGPYE
jgi:mono/diheme cytochrome c family protein